MAGSVFYILTTGLCLPLYSFLILANITFITSRNNSASPPSLPVFSLISLQPGAALLTFYGCHTVPVANEELPSGVGCPHE